MIELERDALVFSFPEVHPHAVLRVEFQRTLRIPDDERSWPLPPGLGCFPLRHVDDFASRVSEAWQRHGGVMLPMYQSEALWLHFSSPHEYPFALKVAAGKIDAVTGQAWSPELHRDPQDYLAVPEQPWLDGFCVEQGIVRQFVAMPLGSGYSAEEQLTGAAEHGGIQILAHPLLASRYRPLPRERRRGIAFSARLGDAADFSMALAPGGRMRQEIYADGRALSDWDRAHAGRCFVHLANSLVWRAITGEAPPTVPPTAREYSAAGLPWFEYYGEGAALEGSAKLAGLASVAQKSAAKGEPENEPADPALVVPLGPKAGRRLVREAAF